jgi:hypothetical protein
MHAPIQDVRVFGLQDRRSNLKATRPWIVRWSIDGRQRSKSFRTKAEGDRFRSQLLRAQYDGDRFDIHSGEPASWNPASAEMRLHVWARRWLAEQWPEWQPRTRDSAVEALTRLIPLVVSPDASPAPPGLRAYLRVTLRPEADGVRAADDVIGRWLDRSCLQLRQLDRAFLAGVDHRLGVGDQGQPLAAWTASRLRKVSHACIRRAVELDILRDDPWPPAPQGRARRAAVRRRRRSTYARCPTHRPWRTCSPRS